MFVEIFHSATLSVNLDNENNIEMIFHLGNMSSIIKLAYTYILIIDTFNIVTFERFQIMFKVPI